MSWREELRPASFRGVEFHVLSASTTFGRRTALHEYPFRDEPYVEDMGRRARTMRIEAIVIGDDYMARRDALIAAVEQAGSGKLVHPYFGELTVSLDDGGAQIDDATANGGMARISFSCIESGEAKFPAAVVATKDIVDARAISAKAASANGFAQVLNVDGLPAFAFDAAFGAVGDALTLVEKVISVVPGVGAGRTNVLGLIGQLRPDLAALLSTPLQLAQRVQAVFSAVRLAVDGSTGTKALGKFSTYGSGVDHLPATTPTRRREASNREAIVELVRSAAAIERAQAAASAEFTDYNSAVQVRDSVVDQIDQVADITQHDDAFQALAALRAAVVRDLGQRGADLARLVNVTLPDSVPALALAYDLYEDPSRDAEIVARNAIKHPGFLPGGQSLEVLGDA